MCNDRIIIVTTEHSFKGERDILVQLMELGVGKIHIRKPGMSKKRLLELLESIPEPFRRRLVIHHHLDLAVEIGAGGIHLPYRQLSGNKFLIPHDLTLSASVHSWDEAGMAMKLCSYCMISPVFDSITKTGYSANPELSIMPDSLRKQKIYALGGITEGHLHQTLAMGYFGIASLGFIWQDPNEAVENAKLLMQELTEWGNDYE